MFWSREDQGSGSNQAWSSAARRTDSSKALVHNADRTLAWTDWGDDLLTISYIYYTLLYQKKKKKTFLNQNLSFKFVECHIFNIMEALSRLDQCVKLWAVSVHPVSFKSLKAKISFSTNSADYQLTRIFSVIYCYRRSVWKWECRLPWRGSDVRRRLPVFMKGRTKVTNSVNIKHRSVDMRGTWAPSGGEGWCNNYVQAARHIWSHLDKILGMTPVWRLTKTTFF